MTCINVNPTAETRYRGRRPTSSLKGAVKSGVRPKPSGKSDSPIVATNVETCKSAVMVGKPEVNDDAAAPAKHVI
jgi:hypothetical protein